MRLKTETKLFTMKLCQRLTVCLLVGCFVGAPEEEKLESWSALGERIEHILSTSLKNHTIRMALLHKDSYCFIGSFKNSEIALAINESQRILLAISLYIN